jgi:fumarate reductase subunit D
MQILKSVILVLFVYLFNLLFPAISTLLDPLLRQEATEAYPTIIGAVIIATLFVLALLYLIHRIDKHEQRRDDERLKKIISEVMKGKKYLDFGGKHGK